MIEIKNLNYKIGKEVLLKDISFSAKNGEIVVITGTNGSGKTTLLKIIAGIIKQQSGEIFINKQEVSKKNITERAKIGLSYAFQQPVAFKGITVKQLLDIANQKNSNINDACDCLSQVGLCARDYINREFNNQLSGGERKRIELALTIAKDAENMLFDEPEAGIDMWSFDNTCKLFSNIKKQNKCVIIVSHNDKIIKIADKILVLNNKQLTESKNLNTNICTKLKGGNDE